MRVSYLVLNVNEKFFVRQFAGGKRKKREIVLATFTSHKRRQLRNWPRLACKLFIVFSLFAPFFRILNFRPSQKGDIDFYDESTTKAKNWQ